ncbi:MAG: nucleoside deaminase [Spirochaetales bacterium]|nr:nucleoside deaminase [Spirochaetales bacterium]
MRRKERDMELLRLAIAAAHSARENGNHPFGAVLADADGQWLLTAENTVVTERDCTGHAETNLMRKASAIYDADFLSQCTLYTSTEPCAMCSTAIFWGNVRRVVYALPETGLYDIVDESSEEVIQIPCREVFQKGKKAVVVEGPFLEEEAALVHQGFWT